MTRRPLLFLLSVFIFLAAVSAEPYVWIGAVTNTSFTIHIEVSSSTDTQLLLSKNANLSSVVSTKPINESNSFVDEFEASSLRRYTFTDLQPLTKYHVAIRSTPSTSRIASVTTYPGPDSTRDIHFAFSSCQIESSDDGGFQAIYSHFVRAEASSPPPTFFMIHMGDLHYADITKNDVSLYRNRFRQVVSERNVHRVMSSMPMAYMYDDHDYGKNNAGFSSPSREAALRAYRKYVPSYTLPSENASYHAFSVGRVRVVMTDLRALAMKEPNSTLAAEQRQWLFSEFATAANYSVLVWMSSKPWITRSVSSGDSWGGYASERRAIADELVRLNVSNLIMIAGDAHMLAADNGSNTDYATNGGAGFPVLHAAPLAHLGTSKGGPYSEGCFAYRFVRNRQYGLLRLSRLAEEGGPCMRFEGYKSGDSEPKILFERCGKLSGFSGSGGNENSCYLPILPVWVSVLIGLGVTGFLILCAMVIMLVLRRKRKKSIPKETVSGTGESDKESQEIRRTETGGDENKVKDNKNE